MSVMQPVYYKNRYINLMHRVDTLLGVMIRNTDLPDIPDGYERNVIHVFFLAAKTLDNGGRFTLHTPKLHSVGETDVTNYKNPLGSYTVIRSYGIEFDGDMVAALVIGENSFATVSKETNYDAKTEKTNLLRFTNDRSLASQADKVSVADEFGVFLSNCASVRTSNHIYDTKYIWSDWFKN